MHTGVTARIRKLAKSFIDSEAVEANESYEEDDYDSDTAEQQQLIRSKKKNRSTMLVSDDSEVEPEPPKKNIARNKRPQSSDSEDEIDVETVPPKKKIVKKQPKAVRIDCSTGVSELPCFEAQLNGPWWLKMTDFRGEKWISLRKFEGDNPGVGATLPFSYLGSLVKAVNALAETVVKHSQKSGY